MSQCLVDTNVLLRFTNAGDPKHLIAYSAITNLISLGTKIVIVPQCLYEYYVVATRPVGSNGLGLSRVAAQNDLLDLVHRFTLQEKEDGLYSNWIDVITTYESIGKPAHDARLIAAMRLHNLKHLLTFNVTDFQRYSQEITLLDPMTM
jgi:predicted nucleic acid-binding protein